MNYTGWECPRCRKVNAPTVLSCSCNSLTPIYPTTWPSAAADGWTCFNCKARVPNGITHVCVYYPASSGSGGTAG